MPISFDAYPVKESLADLDQGLLGAFFRKVSARGRIVLLDDPEVDLVKMQLATHHSPTLAGLLLFGNHRYEIRLKREGIGGEIQDERTITAPLMKAVHDAMLFLGMHLRSSTRYTDIHGGDETWRYPRKAVRELLLNAIIHRDYRHDAHITVTILDDRIIFDSPGGIYGNLATADLMRNDYLASFRNPRLADAFFLMGEIEKYGTGLIRVRELLASMPAGPLAIEATEDRFKTEIRQKAMKKPVEPEAPSPSEPGRPVLTDLEKRILEEIRAKPDINLDLLGSRLVISRNTVIEYIDRLEAKGMIRREKKTKNGSWRIPPH